MWLFVLVGIIIFGLILMFFKGFVLFIFKVFVLFFLLLVLFLFFIYFCIISLLVVIKFFCELKRNFLFLVKLRVIFLLGLMIKKLLF